jgi:hypothetical protein
MRIYSPIQFNKMTRDQSKERFNALPREIRTTVIGSSIVDEIRFFERERKAAISAHSANLRRINERIKSLEKCLSDLKDD